MQLIDSLNNNPKNLFLLDGIGALLSVVLLGLVLPTFKNDIGMPLSTLYFLAAIPIFFSVYDFYCYIKNVSPWQPFLYKIAIANIAYCILSIIMLVIHWSGLSLLGIGYFIVEVIIVFTLALWEIKVSKSRK